MTRKILHLDLDAFFCAVEELHNPALKGQAFAVGGRPDQRGVVASCSYAARQFGVRSALPMSQALRRCPDLLIVPAQHRAYRAQSKKVMALLGEVTPLVEQLSIDEAFLDVSDLRTPLQELAENIQARIQDSLSLPASLGGATNKLVAKIANNQGKAAATGSDYPNAITIVPPGQEAAFLAPLPVRELWGIGPKTEARLHQRNIQTIGQLAQYSQVKLIRLFGKHGAELYERARGVDDRPVETEHEVKSISQENTFAEDVRDEQYLRRTLRQQAEQVGYRLRQQGLKGNTIKIKVRWPDFTTLTRQQTLTQPTNLDEEIYQAALSLFEAVWGSKRRPVRLLGVGISGFDNPGYQLSLWDYVQADPSDERLQETLDDLRHRFGRGVIQRGSDLAD